MCLAAGDLSVGDPGFSAGGVGDEWWSPDGELLSAPKRMAGRGVSYQRSAKQVGVHWNMSCGESFIHCQVKCMDV